MKFGFEDVVIRVKKKSVSVGIVTETAEDYADMSEEEEDDYGQVKEGQCRVAWLPRGLEALEQESKLLLGDKSLMPGDVVEYVKSPGKKGFCTQVKVTSAVKVLSSERGAEPLYILNVEGSRLDPILPFAEGFAVNLGAWVGIIRHVALRVLVRVNCSWDHSKEDRLCWVPERTAVNFDEVGGPDDDVEEYELEAVGFRPGMKLVGPYRHLSSHANWVSSVPPNPPVVVTKKLGKNLRAREVNMTVCDVQVDFVTVSWSHAIVTQAKPPPDKIAGELLAQMKQLHVYESAAIQIGRLKRFTVGENDQIVTASEWHHVLRQKAMAFKEALSSGDGNNNADGASESDSKDSAPKPKKRAKRLLPSAAAKREEKSEDSSGWTTEDKASEDPDGQEDMEEDGSQESEGEGASPRKSSSYPLGRRRRQQLRRRKSALGKESAEEGARMEVEKPRILRVQPGDSVVVETVFTETEADIQWQDAEITNGVRSNKLVTIDHLDEHEYFPGDIVCPAGGMQLDSFGVVKSADHDERTVKVTWFKLRERTEADPPSLTGQPDEKVVEPANTEELAVYDIQEHPEYDFRLGTVVMLTKDFAAGSIDLQSVECCEQARACVGQIVAFEEDGRMKVELGNEETALLWPHMLRRIGDYDSDEGELWARGDSSEEGSEDEWASPRRRGFDEDDGDSDDSWETASDSSDVGGPDKVDEKSAEEADDEGVYAEDPDEPGTVLVNIKKLSPKLMALDYEGTLEEIPSYKLIKKKFLPKVVILERLRDRVWSEVQKFPCDADVSAFDNFSGIKLASMLKDCSIIDELMGTRYFRQRSIDWAAFPHLKRMITPIVLERIAHRIPDMVRLLSIAAPILVPNPADDVAAGGKASEEAAKKMSLLIDAAKLSGRERCDVMRMIDDLVKFRYTGPGTPDEKVKIAIGSALFLDNSPPGSLHGPEAKAYTDAVKDVLGGSRSESLRAALIAFPNEIMCVMNAWLRDRLFRVSVDVVTEFGSNNVMDMELFLPPMNAPYEGDMEFADEFKKIEEELKNEKEPEKPQETGDGVMEVKDEDAKPSGSKEAEFHIASPQAILERGSFEVLESAPDSHRFAASSASAPGVDFNRAVMREMKLLKTSMPKGIYVRAFEDRRDLFSAMIEGPVGTPYEGGLFFFDCQLPSAYPVSPPRVEYISYVTDRLNPNLYEEGKVCVSLLGTWDGRGSELWTRDSSLLQVLVSIQGLILNKEPYYNEAGYERQRGERLAAENSRKYNEMAVVKVVQTMAKLTQRDLPSVFAEDILVFLNKYGWKTVNRFKRWMEEVDEGKKTPEQPPEYPLIPLTRGFILCMRKALSEYEKGLIQQGIKSE